MTDAMRQDAERLKDGRQTSFRVSWIEWHSADVEAANREDVADRFWELIGELGDKHPHLTFRDSRITRIREVREPQGRGDG